MKLFIVLLTGLLNAVAQNVSAQNGTFLGPYDVNMVAPKTAEDILWSTYVLRTQLNEILQNKTRNLTEEETFLLTDLENGILNIYSTLKYMNNSDSGVESDFKYLYNSSSVKDLVCFIRDGLYYGGSELSGTLLAGILLNIGLQKNSNGVKELAECLYRQNMMFDYKYKDSCETFLLLLETRLSDVTNKLTEDEMKQKCVIITEYILGIKDVIEDVRNDKLLEDNNINDRIGSRRYEGNEVQNFESLSSAEDNDLNVELDKADEIIYTSLDDEITDDFALNEGLKIFYLDEESTTSDINEGRTLNTSQEVNNGHSNIAVFKTEESPNVTSLLDVYLNDLPNTSNKSVEVKRYKRISKEYEDSSEESSVFDIVSGNIEDGAALSKSKSEKKFKTERVEETGNRNLVVQKKDEVRELTGNPNTEGDIHWKIDKSTVSNVNDNESGNKAFGVGLTEVETNTRSQPSILDSKYEGKKSLMFKFDTNRNITNTMSGDNRTDSTRRFILETLHNNIIDYLSPRNTALPQIDEINIPNDELNVRYPVYKPTRERPKNIYNVTPERRVQKGVLDTLDFIEMNDKYHKISAEPPTVSWSFLKLTTPPNVDIVPNLDSFDKYVVHEVPPNWFLRSPSEEKENKFEKKNYRVRTTKKDDVSEGIKKWLDNLFKNTNFQQELHSFYDE